MHVGGDASLRGGASEREVGFREQTSLEEEQYSRTQKKQPRKPFGVARERLIMKKLGGQVPPVDEMHRDPKIAKGAGTVSVVGLHVLQRD